MHRFKKYVFFCSVYIKWFTLVLKHLLKAALHSYNKTTKKKEKNQFYGKELKA